MKGTIMIDKYPILKNHLTTLRKTSKDKNHKDNIDFMTQSRLSVINFDAVAREYAKIHHLKVLPTSNDAVFIDCDKIIFIEFKNGIMSKEERIKLKEKIYDSVLMLLDILDQKINYSREHIQYILVYNSEKNSRVSIGKAIAKMAGKHFVELGLDKFKGFCAQDVYTYTKEEFEQEFVNVYEPKSIIE